MSRFKFQIDYWAGLAQAKKFCFYTKENKSEAAATSSTVAVVLAASAATARGRGKGRGVGGRLGGEAIAHAVLDAVIT